MPPPRPFLPNIKPLIILFLAFDSVSTIGVTAKKEYTFELTLAKMKAEWECAILEIIPYREDLVGQVLG